MPLIPTHAYRPVTVGAHTYGCFTLAVRIPGLGQVRIVVSFEHESLTGRSVVLVTNRVDWSAAKTISMSWQRWPTDTFDQDSQGHLGFNDYRLRSTEAIGKHWCVVFVAYSLLHVTCLPTVPDRTKGLIHPIGDACRQQGRAWLQKLLVFVHEQLSHGTTADHVFARAVICQAAGYGSRLILIGHPKSQQSSILYKPVEFGPRPEPKPRGELEHKVKNAPRSDEKTDELRHPPAQSEQPASKSESTSAQVEKATLERRFNAVYESPHIHSSR